MENKGFARPFILEAIEKTEQMIKRYRADMELFLRMARPDEAKKYEDSMRSDMAVRNNLEKLLADLAAGRVDEFTAVYQAVHALDDEEA